MPEIKAPAVIPTKKLTQQQKIVATMCLNKNKDWWLPSDFMKVGLGDLFVGYEASARLSELQTENFEMFESRRNGRFLERRLCFDTAELWWSGISRDLQAVIKKYYIKD